MTVSDRLVAGLGGPLSTLLLVAAWQHRIEVDLVEALGFVTGGACVWLAVRENVWNWPIGIANNVFYVVVFFKSRLYADMSLQVIFAVLGLVGWYLWRRRPGTAEPLRVTRTPKVQWLVLAALGIAATAGWSHVLATIDDAAPFLDALTTASSLIAQYLLTRKYLENWWVWIATDVVSIGLYAQKGLALTAALYAIFLAMCLVGLRSWSPSLVRDGRAGA